jgi:hypothetical protein
MRNALMVMNARDITRCLDSYRKLSIDKVYFRGYTEKQLEGPINRFVHETDYDNYVIISDDQVIEQDTLDLVCRNIREDRVVTGYCVLPGGFVNLCYAPLKDPRPKKSSYSWMKVEDVETFPGDLAPTTFAGFFLTTMSRQMWLDFPFRAYGPVPRQMQSLSRHLPQYGKVGESLRGYASDYNLCYRLGKKGVKIYAVKGALVEHLGGVSWGKRLPLIVGKVKPSTISEP